MEIKLILVEITLNEYGVSEVGPKLEMQLQPCRKEVPNTWSPKEMDTEETSRGRS